MSSIDEYTAGLLQWGDLPTGTFQWIVCDDSYVPDTDADQFVADLTGEYLGGGGRQPFVYLSTTPGAGTQTIRETPPSFTTANDSTHLTNLVLAVDTGTDATDLLIGRWAIDWTADGTTFTPVENPLGLVVVTARADCAVLDT